MLLQTDGTPLLDRTSEEIGKQLAATSKSSKLEHLKWSITQVNLASNIDMENDPPLDCC